MKILSAIVRPALIAVCLSVSAVGGARADRPADAKRAGGSSRDCADVCPEMVTIPAGEFIMGSPDSEPNRNASEGPQHPVRIDYSFAVSKYPITVGQFARFVAETGYSAGKTCSTFEGAWQERSDRNWQSPGFSQSYQNPVVCINFADAQAYVAWLSMKTGKPYRLLSEAEYEYVNRAGASTAYWWGDAIGVNHANCNGCGSAWDMKKQASPVDSFKPNAFGLYDTTGNVWTWVSDCWTENYANAPVDGSARTSGDCSLRVLRGGSWSNNPSFIRSALRFRNSASHRGASYGFRVARAGS